MELYSKELFNASRSKLLVGEQEHRILWDNNEIEAFVDKIAADWALNRQIKSRHHGELREAIELRIEYYKVFLEFIVFPVILDASPAVVQKVSQLVRALQEANASVLSILPLCILLNSNDAEFISQGRVEREITQSLYSSNEDEVSAAARAVVNWARFSQLEILPNPITNLISLLIDHVAHRKPSTIEVALRYLIQIFKYSRMEVSQPDIDKVCIGLKALLTETDLSNLTSPQNNFYLYFGLAARSKIPEIRHLCSELAKVLYDDYESRNEPAPDAISQWKQAALKDALPEVRRVWDEPAIANFRA